MIDDLLGTLFEGATVEKLNNSRRVQLLFRILFGLIGGALGAIGAVHFGLTAGLTDNVAMRASFAALFVFLACFSLFNIALGRPWRWPGKLFLASLAAIFITRILWGA
jgi:hypothetical protein